MSTPTPQTTVYVDTETGGLRTADRPWEIALVVDGPDGLHERHLLHVADFNPVDADPKALELNGFYDRHPLWSKDTAVARCGETCHPTHGMFQPASLGCMNDHGLVGPDQDVPVRHVVEHEGCLAAGIERIVRGALIVACNPLYDVPRLTAMLERHNVPFTGHYRGTCATTYAAGVVGRHPATANSVIGMELGIDREAHGVAHGALPDTLYARDLFRAALARVHVAA